MERYGIVSKVLSGDTVAVDNGYTIIRYSNVWAPDLSDPVGRELHKLNEEMVLGKEIRFVPTGHMHYDSIAIVSDVYLGQTWINQTLRYWLNHHLPTFSPVLNQEGAGPRDP